MITATECIQIQLALFMYKYADAQLLTYSLCCRIKYLKTLENIV